MSFLYVFLNLLQWNNKDINFLVRTSNNTYFEIDNRYRKSSTPYMIGDIVYSKKLLNTYRLECVVSGISDSVEPTYSGPAAGQYVQDGTVTWIIDDIHDSNKIGNIILGNILYHGYIQANGALLTDASINYPRLINFLNDNTSLLAVDDTAWNSNKALYVYDSFNDTLRIPDAAGRVLQGGVNIESIESGLPNIIANFGVGQAIRSLEGYTGSNQETPNGAVIFSSEYSNFNRYKVGPNGPYPIHRIWGINAYNYSSIYGSSTTVQPPAITLIPQIKY